MRGTHSTGREASFCSSSERRRQSERCSASDRGEWIVTPSIVRPNNVPKCVRSPVTRISHRSRIAAAGTGRSFSGSSEVHDAGGIREGTGASSQRSISSSKVQKLSAAFDSRFRRASNSTYSIDAARVFGVLEALQEIAHRASGLGCREQNAGVEEDPHAERNLRNEQRAYFCRCSQEASSASLSSNSRILSSV